VLCCIWQLKDVLLEVALARVAWARGGLRARRGADDRPHGVPKSYWIWRTPPYGDGGDASPTQLVSYGSPAAEARSPMMRVDDAAEACSVNRCY
jgi:hypothetical protein